MNWLSRIFRKRRAESEYGEGDYGAGYVASSADSDAAGSRVPGFTSSASSLDGVIGSASSANRGFAYRRAFLPSQPVSDIAAFAGRSDLLRRVIRAIEDQQLHVIIYGDRGIGKTSVLRVVRELATKANYVVQYTSCGEETEFSDTFRAIAARIPLLYDAEFDPSVEAVERGGTMADRLPPGNFSVSQLSEVLASVSGTRVVIILDEFDRATSPKFRNAIAELIKNLSDRSIRVQLLIAGVAANLTDLIAHVPSIRRNIVGIGVPNMTDEEVRDLIAIGERTGGIAFTDAATRQLVQTSAGLPYLAALIGQHATLAAIEAGAVQVDTAHIDTARVRAADDIGSRLSPIVRHALNADEPSALVGVIARAATEAVRNGGLIKSSDVLDEIGHLTAPHLDLFKPIANHPGGAWQFSEDGTSTYVWLHTQSA